MGSVVQSRRMGMEGAAGKAARALLLGAAAAALALLLVELGLRGSARLWRLRYRSQARPETMAVYVLGESTAFGEPFAPKISFARIVSLRFGGRLRGRPLEIVSLARPGSNTEDQYWRLFRELSLRPRRDGLVLIYAGINETSHQAAPSWLQRWADRSWLISRLASWRRQRRGQGPGLDYEHRLGRLLDLAKSFGYPVVLSTLAGNVRDFQPDIEGGWSPEQAKVYVDACQAERAGRLRWAAQAYTRLARQKPDAGLLHRAARCRLALGERAAAKKLFGEAIDLGSSLRPTRQQDEAIRRAARLHGAALSDSRALFEAAAPDGLPGRELFMDAHHPNLRGTLILAEGFARQVSRLLNAPEVGPRLSEAELRRACGYAQEDERRAFCSRFVWYCGEAYHRQDSGEAIAMARRYLALAERSCGSRLAAYRFLLALLERDEPSLRRAIETREVYGDRDHLDSLGNNPDWSGRLVREAGLAPELEARARQIVDFAALASGFRRSPGGGLSRATVSWPERLLSAWQRRKFRDSKEHSDRGVALILSGQAADGERELAKALDIDPDNAEAALSLCTWQAGQQHWEAAAPYCDQAWRAASRGPGRYSAEFTEKCREARARLKTRNPLSGVRS